jgi:hypothetical protein
MCWTRKADRQCISIAHVSCSGIVTAQFLPQRNCTVPLVTVINNQLAHSVGVTYLSMASCHQSRRQPINLTHSSCLWQQARRRFFAAIGVNLGAGLANILAAHSAKVALLGEACTHTMAGQQAQTTHVDECMDSWQLL